MNKKILLISLIILLLAGFATASLLMFPYHPDEPPLADDTGSTQNGIEAVVNANNQFAFDVYSELSKSETGNIFYSPYSLSAALAMTYEGANGETAAEIKSVLHYPEIDILRPNFAAIYNDINKESKDNILKTGNALWVQQDYQLLPDFLTRVESYYGGKATNLDFVESLEPSRKTINAFIAGQTNNKIKELIPQGILDAMTRLVLTNAVYFKGTWEWQFEQSKTFTDDFKVNDNTVVQAEMMRMKPDKTTFNYANTDSWQILELPYKGDEISMLILLPTSNLDSVETKLTAENLNQLKSELKETKLDSIILPKFEFNSKYFMQEALSAMGMPTAFSPSADFSGMTGNKDLLIDSVIHEAYIKVNEEGTEAAAATAVTMKLTAISPQNVFNADHPFIFLIQDKDNGNILFLGRVVDPTQ